VGKLADLPVRVCADAFLLGPFDYLHLDNWRLWEEAIKAAGVIVIIMIKSIIFAPEMGA